MGVLDFFDVVGLRKTKIGDPKQLSSSSGFLNKYNLQTCPLRSEKIEEYVVR